MVICLFFCALEWKGGWMMGVGNGSIVSALTSSLFLGGLLLLVGNDTLYHIG
jgi:hypothetical protein